MSPHPALTVLTETLRRHASWLLAGQLLALYVTLQSGPSGLLGKAAFIVHLGLFLVWQPLVEGETRLSPRVALLILILIGVTTAALGSWVLVLWVMLTACVVGGRVLLGGRRTERLSYLLALMFLVLALLLIALPDAMGGSHLPDAVRWASSWGLPVLLILIAASASGGHDPERAEVVDFFNSVLIFLLQAVLVLGTLAGMMLFAVPYVEALLKALVMLGGALLLLGWVWSPHLGFGGVESFIARHLMSVGVSAEAWLEALADIALTEDDAERFVAEACRELHRRMPWVAGLQWRTPNGGAASGRMLGRTRQFVHQHVVLDVATRYPLSPALIWHLNLLVKVLGEFHAGKERQALLRELSYLKAVHETGARLTHDVKNLLQSLQTLVFAAEHADPAHPDEFRALMQRQLPTISLRLAATLDKLREPTLRADESELAAARWWDEVRRQYGQVPWLTLEDVDGEPGQVLQVRLFASVLDNLLSNVEQKRAVRPTVRALARLLLDGQGRPRLEVEDDGPAIGAEIVHVLFKRPLRSSSGLGIGLYQSSQLAERAGYGLVLEENRDGMVRFVLAARASA